MLQKVCIEMNRQRGNLVVSSVRSEMLRWSVGDNNGDLHRILNDLPPNALEESADAGVESDVDRYFDVVYACDCLFFEDFHDALIDILLMSLGFPRSGEASDRTSAPNDATSTSTSTMKRVVLFQPNRGGSMDRFIEKAHRYFEIQRIEDYDHQVGVAVFFVITLIVDWCCVACFQMTALRQQYLASDVDIAYRDDVHYPILLILTPRY